MTMPHAETLNQSQAHNGAHSEAAGSAEAQNSPDAKAQSAWMKLLRDVYKDRREYLHEAEGHATQVRENIAELVWDKFGLTKALLNADKNLRGGRDLGNLSTRGARIIAHLGLAAVTVRADMLDKGFKDKFKVNEHMPISQQIRNKLIVRAGEYVSDWLIGEGVNFVGRRITGKKDFDLSSEGTHVASEAINWFNAHPRIPEGVNPSSLEFALRAAIEVPVAGAFVEKAYVGVNQAVERMHSNRLGKMILGLGMHVAGGFFSGGGHGSGHH